MRIGLFELKPMSSLGLFVFLAVLLLCAYSTPAQDSGDRKRVLLLFTHDSQLPAQVIVERSIRATLKNGAPVPLEIYSEYLDAVRTNLTDYEPELVSQLTRKYGKEKFDLVIAINPPALKLLIAHRSELAPDTPVVFLVLDQGNLSDIKLGPNTTGVWGETDYTINLQLALALRPETKNVVVIAGVSDWDKYWLARVKPGLAQFEDKLAFSYLVGLTVGEQQQALAALSPDSVVLFISSIEDNAGNKYSNLEILSQITRTSNAPVFGSSDAQMGRGIVGGHLLSFDALGVGAGLMGKRVLAGEKADAIEPHAIASVPMFDYRQLQRWQISEASLPEGSIIEFKQPTLWEAYKWYLVGLITAIAVETLLIVLLLYLRLRRRQAEAEAARLGDRITEIVSNVPGIVWESRTDPATKKRTTTFVSDYVQRMLGYTAEEWLNQPPGFGFKLVPEEDRERVRRESDAVIETGEEAVSEFRWETKDGRVRWVENHLSPLVDSDAGIVGLRGVALDITDRKLAEEHARQAEEKDKAILSVIPDLMFIQNLEGVYLDYHATDPTALFAPPEVFIGKNARDILPPDLAERFFECFERTEEGGEPQIVEYELKIGGEEKWFEARIVRAGGKVFSMVRDITDRIRALEELLRSEERFGKAFRSNPQPMAITTIKGGLYIDVNESFCSASGYTRDEVIGRTTLELGVWGSPEERARFINAIQRDGSVANFQTEFHTKNGAVRQFLTSAERLDIGGEDCLLVASTDITERYAAQQAVSESEARFRNMAETAPVMIWVSDEKQATTYVNKQWLKLTGGELEDELGSGWTRHIHPDDLASMSQSASAAYAGRVRFELEFRVRRGSDGEYRWVYSTGTPRFSADGEFVGYIGTTVDITERKESERDLRYAHDELSQLKTQLEAENIYLQEELRQDQSFGDIVGQSSAIKYVLFKVTQVAPTDSTVLIIGETGTGKELVARAIHEGSKRKERPLIKVNCAALSPTLIESELFGHEKGAFTGAGARRLGRFELANSGTILLDEIGELPLDLQSKLLRVLQEGEFERVGGSKTIKVDVRVIASTNRDLKQAAEKGKFREDLWYRLNVFPITTPPLRDRRDDIPILTEHFAKSFARKLGKKLTGVSPETLNALCSYSWPGNVRELANVTERAIINLRGTVLKIQEDFRIREAETLATSVKTLDDNERDHILRVLEDLDWRIGGPGGAAIVLGINPSTLRTRMLKLGIHRPNGQSSATSMER